MSTTRVHLPPGTTDTFHHPCWTCGQAVEVVTGEQQPHDCRTYDTDSERICAAYWAGYDRAREEPDR